MLDCKTRPLICAPHPLVKPSIYLTPMTDVLHDDVHRVGVHLVDNSVIPNPQAV